MALEKNCKWNFYKWNSSMTLHGPNDAIVQSFNQDFYDSLVRESIQNSLDAVKDSSKPVTVSFNFGKIYKKDYPELYDIEKHIQGCLDYYSDNRAKELYEPMLTVIRQHVPLYIDLITVSDYNTTGMRYDPKDPKNPFSAFAKSVGFSLKTSKSSGGSFGFGKAAYFQMSPLRTVLISTMDEDSNTYFEGVSRLSTHEVKGITYCDVGYYDCNNGQPAVGEDIPIDFLRRESGTDITLLGRFLNIRSTDEMEIELIRSILINFWMAIYSKKLVVNVGHNHHISHLEIPTLIRKFFTMESKHRRNPRPFFEAFTTQQDKNHLKFKKTLSTIGDVAFYVIKDSNAKRSRIAFMRKPMMLVEIKNATNANGMYGLFLCLDEKGNELLSNIEDASHSSWSTKGKTGKAYEFACKILDEITSFIDQCIQDIYDSNDQVEYFDIGIGSSEDDLEGLLTDNSNRYNPFNSVKTGELTTDGSSPVNTLRTSDRKDNPDDANLYGRQVHGRRNSSAATIKTIGTGHKNKQSKTKGGAGMSGVDKTLGSPEIGNGDEDFTLFSPAQFRVAAVKEHGHWIHVLMIHAEEPLDHVYIEIRAGVDDGDEKIAISEVTPGELTKQKGVVRFDHLDQGVSKVKVKFYDDIRHTLKLK